MDIDERIKRIAEELDKLKSEHPEVPYAFVASRSPGSLTHDWSGDPAVALGGMNVLGALITSQIVRIIDQQNRPRVQPARVIPMTGHAVQHPR